MGLKRTKRLKNKWFSVGDYYCPGANVINNNCVKKSDVVSGKVDIVNKVDISRNCVGEGYISGKIPTKGIPYYNQDYVPDVAGSWCWNKENDYCSCDCSVYTDRNSCYSGDLDFTTSECGSNCYCWGCNWR
tara:strand:+ start:703 stop:1095 length:393 start_codon:yes stop_codon:yes gene_type:complete